MGTCSACNFSFCCLCRKTYHGVADCSMDAVDKKALVTDYREADNGAKEEMEKRYGKTNLQRILDDTLASEWINDNAKRCPNCKVGIEVGEQKYDGCNKMTCWKCQTYFCWICRNLLSRKDPYHHYSSRQSPCYNKLFQGLSEADIMRIVAREEDEDEIAEAWDGGNPFAAMFAAAPPLAEFDPYF